LIRKSMSFILFRFLRKTPIQTIAPAYLRAAQTIIHHVKLMDFF
jgi:hypothetical protein